VKYYERLVELGCFTRADVAALTGNTETAHSIISAYKKKGLIESVKRDLFVVISIETKQPVPNRYAVASHAAPGAYVSHHSAFEYYGYANQVYYELYVASKARFRTFEYDGVIYRHLPPRIDIGVDSKHDGVRVTDTERTVIDSINDFEKIGGLEELLRCLDMIPHLDYLKLLEYLAAYDTGFLYQKTGYVLEYYKEQMSLPGGFFISCQSNATQGGRYLFQGLCHKSHTLNRDWRLYVPVDLMAITRKGENYIERVQ